MLHTDERPTRARIRFDELAVNFLAAVSLASARFRMRTYESTAYDPRLLMGRSNMVRTLSLASLLTVFSAAAAVAQTANCPAGPPGWIADANGCRVWNECPQHQQTIRWSGACSGGLAQGRGRLEWFRAGKAQAQAFVEAPFRDGRANGRGVATVLGGTRYEGDFVDGAATGRGVMTWANNRNRYEGDFVDDEWTGRGVYTFPNGDRYEGEYVNSKRNGRGVATWVNGDRYEGNYVEGRAHGFGTYRRASGETYTGSWTNGCFSQGNRRAVVGDRPPRGGPVVMLVEAPDWSQR
jgi:hypothetical protein